MFRSFHVQRLEHKCSRVAAGEVGERGKGVDGQAGLGCYCKWACLTDFIHEISRQSRHSGGLSSLYADILYHRSYRLHSKEEVRKLRQNTTLNRMERLS